MTFFHILDITCGKRIENWVMDRSYLKKAPLKLFVNTQAVFYVNFS